MKKSYLLTPIFVAAASAAAQPANAAVLSYYSFNGSTPFTSDGGARTSSLTYSFNSSSVKVVTPGSTLTPPTGYTAGNSLALDEAAGPGANNYIQFTANSVGYKVTSITFDTRKGGGGFNNNVLQYSTDGGTTFNQIGSAYSTTNTFVKQTFNTSSLNGIEGNSNALFRIVFGGGSTGSSNNNYVDNLTINAVTTPEPSTWAMMALGIGALAFMSRRRKREAGEANLVGAVA